jgi:hypothetical protein
VKPQQKRRSIVQLKSRSARDGKVFVCFGFATVGDVGFGDLVATSSSSSSSSITNCGSSDPTSAGPSSTSGASSLFHSTSCSNTFISASLSKTTGNTRCKIRRQFSTSFVVFLSPALDLMSDVAYAATDAFDAEGKVWSDTRLKRRPVMTRTSVATFSGASTSARRTDIGSALSDKGGVLEIALYPPSCGEMSENTSEAESNRTRYCTLC